MQLRDDLTCRARGNFRNLLRKSREVKQGGHDDHFEKSARNCGISRPRKRGKSETVSTFKSDTMSVLNLLVSTIEEKGKFSGCFCLFAKGANSQRMGFLIALVRCLSFKPFSDKVTNCLSARRDDLLRTSPLIDLNEEVVDVSHLECHWAVHVFAVVTVLTKEYSEA